MKALEEKIRREGNVLPGDVLKVNSFLNHQIDAAFTMEMGKEIARLFKDSGATRILTIESSGIALALAAAVAMGIPFVFAKKNRSINLGNDTYHTKIHSYTHNQDYDVVVEKKFIHAGDKVLIVDDFLASGKAIIGLCEIVESAGATVVGACAAITKSYQDGEAILKAKGIHTESLAVIESMENGKIVFRDNSGM